MIVKMKDLLLFTLPSTVEETIHNLGELGVVDIKEIDEPAGELIERRMNQVARTESAISILKNYVKRNCRDNVRNKYNSNDPLRITNRILASGDYKQQCQSKLDNLNKQLDWYDTWGEHIEIKDIKFLQSKGIYIRLYYAVKPLIRALSKDRCIVAFPAQGDKTPIALFTRDESDKLNLEEEQLPVLPVKEIRQQILRKKRQLTELDLYLEDQADNLELLYDYVNLLKDRFEVQKVLECMGDIEGTLKYLRGFIPQDAVDSFKSTAQRHKWGYQISEPERLEEVPVYIKNPKWISIINPVMKFIDIVPGYKEVDVSIYFLIAFALFFAMLVGDAGYGVMFLLITFLFRKKLTSQVRLLIYVLSGATITWGILSGTYFGAEEIASLPIFNNLIIKNISSFGVDNISFMMHLSFIIGAVHLTLAHSIQFFRLINSTRALSELGWISFIWALYFVVEKLVLGKEVAEWNSWLFVIGAVLVILFSKEGKNLTSSILISLSNLPLSLINGFSDIVSYVRLFAVGMATATVASSFNNMILSPEMDMSLLNLFMASIALFLGHGLNIALALMAVMVHGIRLNMLEFAGHLGIQFSGEAYKPFKLSFTQKEIEGLNSNRIKR